MVWGDKFTTTSSEFLPEIMLDYPTLVMISHVGIKSYGSGIKFCNQDPSDPKIT